MPATNYETSRKTLFLSEHTGRNEKSSRKKKREKTKGLKVFLLPCKKKYMIKHPPCLNFILNDLNKSLRNFQGWSFVRIASLSKVCWTADKFKKSTDVLFMFSGSSAFGSSNSNNNSKNYFQVVPHFTFSV